jgi:enolase
MAVPSHGGFTPEGIVSGKATVAAVFARRVLNSHGGWIGEYTVQLRDGRQGRGSAPRGETPSIYEHVERSIPEPARVAELATAELGGLDLEQETLDEILVRHRDTWGPGATYGISVAFFEATWQPVRHSAPRLLFNMLNGGLHAYTNPITSDYTEYLLASQTDDLERTIGAYTQLLREARRRLSDFPMRDVGGNRVHDLGAEPDSTAFRILSDLLVATATEELFETMVDASAGDWYADGRYRLPVTGRELAPEQVAAEWIDHADRFALAIVEDPFAETDLEAWTALASERPESLRLFGDNLTSTRIEELETKASLVDGVLVKPDQNGTVSGAIRFAHRASAAGLEVAASHRSIETDSPFLVHLAAEVGAGYVKIGPYSDFSSIMRTNELLRMTAP